MSLTQILVAVLGALGALAVSAYTYRVLEPNGRGRSLLAAFRTIALLLIVLLLLDPRINMPAAGRGRGSSRVILDGSLSMMLGSGNDNVWRRAVAEAGRAAGGSPVLVAGNGVRAVSTDSLNRLTASAGDSRVLPALQSAAEAGADRVVVITDGAIEDVAEVERWLPALGMRVEVRNLGDTRPDNRAIRTVQAPAWAEAGKPLTLRISIAANSRGRAGVVVRQNNGELARGDVALIPGGVAVISLPVTAQGPREGGLVRYDVALDPPDSIPDDDVRSVYVFVSEKPAGVAIVSFEPDWEPRFLHPVLESALGLPVRTFLRLQGGQYMRAGSALDAGDRVVEAVVQQAVAQADLLVLHGFTEAAPDWAIRAARNARRLLVFPGQAGSRIPIASSAPTEGDWYVSPDLSPTPIAPLLSGIDVSGLPPLTALQTVAMDENAWAPLRGGRTPRGGNLPLVVAEEQAGRRWVVAPGSGYWRWAFRGGPARDAYTRLWSALAGWIVQDRAPLVAGAPIRPVERALARAVPIRWVAPGLRADSFVLALHRASGETSQTTLVPEQGDTAVSEAPAPGHYDYDIAAYRDGREIARAHGPITVESYSPEFMHAQADMDRLTKAATILKRAGAGSGRPLHTFAWLYVLIVALLCAEWALRRRWGLR